MAAVTVERIATVHAHITDALIRTSSNSMLSKQEQDMLLGQCCAEACDVIQDWLASTWWDWMRPDGDGPIADCFPSQNELEKFLGPEFSDVLAQADRHGMSVSPSLVGEARAALAATARRHRGMRRQQLFSVANARVRALGREVCALAHHLDRRAENSASAAARRKRSRAVLAVVGNLLISLTIAMAGAGPHQMAKNLGEWEHEAVKMVMVHHIADRAKPDIRIAPHMGPRLR